MPDRRQSTTRSIVRVAALAVAGCSLAGLALAHGPAAGAVGANAFDGTAAGYGFTTLIQNGSIPAGISPELDGPSAQAHLDSLGDSDAFAAAPYLGEDVTGLPGLASGLAGIPLPADPLYVSTSVGDPKKTANAGPISLTATSRAGHASSEAAVASGSTGATSNADVTVDPDQSVQAITTSVIRGLDIAGVVNVSAVDTSAEADRASDGTVTTHSTLTIGHITVPGLALSIPDCLPNSVPLPVGGVPTLPTLPAFCTSQVPGLKTFAGKTLTAPDLSFHDGTFSVNVFPEAGGPSQAIPIPADTVFTALAAAGVTATYQKPLALKDNAGKTDGVQGASLTFATTLPSPPPPISSELSGTTTITSTIGNVSAHVDYTVVPDVPDGVTVPVTTNPLPAGTGTTPVGTSPGSTAGAAGSTGGGAFTDPGTGAVTGAPTDGAIPQVAAPQGVGGAPPQPEALRTSNEHRLANIYPILVIAGLLAYAMTHVARTSGRRFRWIS